MSTSRVPPILEPYTQVPLAGELVLLTNVLGAGTNWLLSQYLCGALADDAPRNRGIDDELRGLNEKEEDEIAVVLVSWLRDLEFWIQEGRKAWGLDLTRLSHKKRFLFIDGLTQLFVPSTESSIDAPSRAQPTALQTPDSASSSPIRSNRAITPRGPPTSSSISTPHSASRTPPTPSPSKAQEPTTLTSPSLSRIESAILAALSSLSTASTPKRVLLILDHPDLLLATGASASASPLSSTSQVMDTSTALEPLRAMLHTLRQHSHAMVISLAADTPLAGSGDGGGREGVATTPLETNHAALLTGLAHVANLVLSVRLLDTGFARDVSGVVRISGQGGGEEDAGGREVLYHVGRDGVVKAFERGGAGGVGDGG